MMKAHDSDADGQVQIGDIMRAWGEAEVPAKCLRYAENSHLHLTTHHDHDRNGYL